MKLHLVLIALLASIPSNILGATLYQADWGNDIQAVLTQSPCQDSEFINQGYQYAVDSSIPVRKMKRPTDAFYQHENRAYTVRGCWFKKDDGLLHAKMRRKHDNKVWELDLNLNDGAWNTKSDAEHESHQEDPVAAATRNTQVDEDGSATYSSSLPVGGYSASRLSHMNWEQLKEFVKYKGLGKKRGFSDCTLLECISKLETLETPDSPGGIAAARDVILKHVSDKEYIEYAKEVISSQFVDPDSTSFRNGILISTGKPELGYNRTYCAEANAKNRLGAYTGYELYIVDRSTLTPLLSIDKSNLASKTDLAQKTAQLFLEMNRRTIAKRCTPQAR